MAKPDCDDGWFKLSIELEAALAFAGFSRVARTVLRYVFTQIYGRGVRPTLAFLPQKFLAGRIGQNKQNVWRAIRELVESKVLIEVKTDHYRFVKDYETWVTWGRGPGAGGRPRLSPVEAEDCRNAPAYADMFRVRKDADLLESPSNPTGLPAVIQRDYSSNPTGLPESSNGITRVIQRDYSPLEERARVRRDEEDKERGGESAPARKNRNPSLAQIREAEHRERAEGFKAVFKMLAETDPIEEREDP